MTAAQPCRPHGSARPALCLLRKRRELTSPRVVACANASPTAIEIVVACVTISRVLSKDYKEALLIFDCWRFVCCSIQPESAAAAPEWAMATKLGQEDMRRVLVSFCCAAWRLSSSETLGSSPLGTQARRSPRHDRKKRRGTRLNKNSGWCVTTAVMMLEA